MQIPQKSRDIIRVAQLHADAPRAKLRKASGYRDHALSYHLSRATEQQLLRRRCFLDLQRIGLQYHEVLLAFSSSERGSRALLQRRLQEAPQVSFLARLGGEFHYALTLVTRNNAELHTFLFALFSEFTGAIFEKSVALRVSLHYFGNKYLSPKRGLRERLSYSPSSQAVVTDLLDRRILRYLSESGETSAPAIARELSFPASTVAFRLKRLIQERVLVGYYYELQSARLGFQSHILLLCTKGFSAEFREALERYCLSSPYITLLIHSIGAWDFEVVVDSENPAQLSEILDQLYDRFGASINWIKVLPLLEHTKVRDYPLGE
jgi:DNA-binding Lrp family transcriptional regulator